MNKLGLQMVAFDQLYHEISLIVKIIDDSETGYFNYHEQLLSYFESYLFWLQKCPSKSNIQTLLKQNSLLLFKEKVAAEYLAKYPRLLYLLESRQLPIKHQIENCSRSQLADNQHILVEQSITQLIFVFYLSQQVKRNKFFKHNFGDILQSSRDNMMFLQEIMSILETISQNYQSSTCQSNCFLAINTEKLMERLLKKAVDMQIGNSKCGQVNKICQKNILKVQTKNIQEHPSDFKGKKYDHKADNKNKQLSNLSLVSVQSKYEQSCVFEKRTQFCKSSNKQLMDLGISFGNFLDQRIFKNISLEDYVTK